jgi:hypothetical protein
MLLLNTNADPCATDSQKNSPLHAAAEMVIQGEEHCLLGAIQPV